MRDIPQLDLHGRAEEDAFNLLDCFIRDNKNEEQVLVITGIGRGVIQKEVLKYLELTGYFWSYQKVRGFENRGALEIDLC